MERSFLLLLLDLKGECWIGAEMSKQVMLTEVDDNACRSCCCYLNWRETARLEMIMLVV